MDAPKTLPEVLDQLGKLQALASRAGTEGEARAATLAIQRLVARYRLTEEDLRRAQGPAEHDHVHVKIFEGRRMPTWLNDLAHVLAFHNGCVVVQARGERKRPSLWFVYGRYADAQIVLHLYAWLSVEGPRLAPRQVRRGNYVDRTTPSYQRDWCTGFVFGIDEQLRKDAHEVVTELQGAHGRLDARAIVLVDQRRAEATAALMKFDPGLKTRPPRDRRVITEALEAGRKRGRRHHLGKSLGEGKETS
jgi:hypothetical protein